MINNFLIIVLSILGVICINYATKTYIYIKISILANKLNIKLTDQNIYASCKFDDNDIIFKFIDTDELFLVDYVLKGRRIKDLEPFYLDLIEKHKEVYSFSLRDALDNISDEYYIEEVDCNIIIFIDFFGTNEIISNDSLNIDKYDEKINKLIKNYNTKEYENILEGFSNKDLENRELYLRKSMIGFYILKDNKPNSNETIVRRLNDYDSNIFKDIDINDLYNVKFINTETQNINTCYIDAINLILNDYIETKR